MASFYFDLRKYVNKRGEQPICLVVIIDRKVSYKSTGYSIGSKYWDASKQRIKPSHPNCVEWNSALEQKLSEVKSLYSNLDKTSRPTVKAISNAIMLGDTFKAIAEQYEAVFRDNGQIGTANRYKTNIRLIEKSYPVIKIGEMNNAWVISFKKNLEKTYAPNTIVSRLRFVNAIINKAVADSLYPYNPMATAKKGSYKPPQKQTLTMQEIDRLYKYTTTNDWKRIAKLTALFSYYCVGARFKDVLLMHKSALYDEDGTQRIRWTANKTMHTTGEIIDIPVSHRLQHIIKQLDNNGATLTGLVNINLQPVKLHAKISKVQAQINKSLKVIFRECGINKNLSFHDMRRAFSNHAQAIGKNIYMTASLMGHDKVATTEIYLGKDRKGMDELLKSIYN